MAANTINGESEKASLSRDGDYCEYCKFFQEYDTESGLCRRYAPSPFVVLHHANNEHPTSMHQWTSYPRVEEAGWCGDFELGEAYRDVPIKPRT